MLFHSKEFLFVLLPTVFLGWLFFIGIKKFSVALLWLVLGSLVFYAYWYPPYLILLLISICANYLLGRIVDPTLGQKQNIRFYFLFGGIALNLIALAYYKYANFFVDTINHIFQTGWILEKIFLPLAISFFTFQQIAYLVDCYRGLAREHSFLKYVFFVSFFPQLIAGPIVHHGEILAQIRRKVSLSSIPLDFTLGLSIFCVGLFKKMVIADSCGVLASPFFDASAQGLSVNFEQSWCGVLAYTFQIYYDFSGYSDMAIGLARMFSIILPENFSAPYRSISIIEFWRRWHITLSRFLRDYLYIPLGGNRQGVFFRYRNLFLTMLLGGLWHGAGWTFLIWGALHGMYLISNHGWNALLKCYLISKIFQDGIVAKILGFFLTMLSVVIAWVFFRAESLASAFDIIRTMFSFSTTQGVAYTYPGGFWFVDLRWPFLIFLSIFCFIAPTTQTYFQSYVPTLQTHSTTPLWWHWRPNFFHGVFIGTLILIIIKQSFSLATSEFLYFNF